MRRPFWPALRATDIYESLPSARLDLTAVGSASLATSTVRPLFGLLNITALWNCPMEQNCSPGYLLTGAIVRIVVL